MISIRQRMLRKHTDLIHLYQDSIHKSVLGIKHILVVKQPRIGRCSYSSVFVSVHVMYTDPLKHRIFVISRRVLTAMAHSLIHSIIRSSNMCTVERLYNGHHWDRNECT